MHSEIFMMLLVFLSSANREIVKSVLGFIKLAIHTLPADLIRPHLKDLVPTLLNWSHDHKNHFKVKVRHIFERMLRRFSWDEVYSCAGEEEAAKVLVNIKKRKDRAKRKRANKPDEDEDAKKVSRWCLCRHIVLIVAVRSQPFQNLLLGMLLRMYFMAARVN
jgi:ribosomal RNA-processing protein 12